MGWFTKKGRLEQQRELIEMARRALDTLKVTTHRQQYEHGSCIEPRSWDYKSIPLEYRKMVGDGIETLVFHVYDEVAAKEAGKVGTLTELGEALATVQMALTDAASISNVTVKRRQALRAQAVVELLELIEGRASFGHGGLDPFLSVHRDRILSSYDEALAWFKSQSELDTAIGYRSEIQKRSYPRVMLAKLQEATERLRVQAPKDKP